MRYTFFIIVFSLLQLFSLGAAYSLAWWLQPWTSDYPAAKLMVFAVIFIITNGLLLLSVSKVLANAYRWISGWMLVMHYLILSALLGALLYGGYWLFMTVTAIALQDENLLIYALRLITLLAFIGVFIHSLYSAYSPIVRRLNITIDKPFAQPISMMVASDLHIGRLFGNKAIARLQRLIDNNRPDMLLMPGDIMDDNVKAFTHYNMADNLAKLCASLPFGVYATLGNHDLYGHELPISESLRSAGVQLLNDDVVRLDYNEQPIWLVGRFDNHKRARVATTELLAQVNTNEPVVLLDHRPSDIMAHSQLPIDLQVSGHTHNGQIFPANFIVSAINRIGYGYEAINNSHFVVSSGYGFWGIPFRLGSRSEVWLITLNGQ